MSANHEHLMDAAKLEIGKLPFLPDDPTAWLVNRRSKIMGLLLELVRYFEDKENRSTVKDTWLSFSVLLGAGFSLWRAVFLAVPKDKNGKSQKSTEQPADTGTKSDMFEAAHVAAGAFFTTLIRDNNIAFPHDSANREWSVGYYLNDAMFRLYWLHNLHHEVFTGKEFVKVANYWKRGIKGKGMIARFDRQLIWDTLYEALATAFVSFGAEKQSIVKYWENVEKEIEEENKSHLGTDL